MATMEEILTGSADKPAEPEAEAKEEKPEQEAAAETPEQKPEEKSQEETSVSAEEEAPKGEKAAPPAAEKTEPSAPIAALLDEREKRKEAERKLAEIEKAQKPEEETDFFEDPEGALRQRDQAFEEKILQNKLEMSQAMAKQSHPDFDEVLGKFNKAMETDETLKGRAKAIWNDALTQPHPALSIYNAVQRELALQEMSDPDELRKKIEAEVRAELAKEKEEEKPASPDIPESLADERSVGSRKGPEWAGPTPLGEIIKSA